MQSLKRIYSKKLCANNMYTNKKYGSCSSKIRHLNPLLNFWTNSYLSLQLFPLPAQNVTDKFLVVVVTKGRGEGDRLLRLQGCSRQCTCTNGRCLLGTPSAWRWTATATLQQHFFTSQNLAQENKKCKQEIYLKSQFNSRTSTRMHEYSTKMHENKMLTKEICTKLHLCKFLSGDNFLFSAESVFNFIFLVNLF